MKKTFFLLACAACVCVSLFAGGATWREISSDRFRATVYRTPGGDRLCELCLADRTDTILYANYGDTVMSYSGGTLRVVAGPDAKLPEFIAELFENDSVGTEAPADGVPDTLTTAYLRARYPEAFVERLPRVSLKDVHTGNRVDLRAQASDAIVVVLCARDPSTPALMERVRSEAGRYPVFWAFTDTRIEDILEVCPESRPGETALSNASLPYPPRTVLRIRHGRPETF